MRNFIHILVIAFILVPFATKIVSSAEDKLTLTQKQKNFEKKVTNDVGIYKAEWINNYSIDVIYDELSSGTYSEEGVQIIANLLAVQGFLYTGKNVCVKMLDSSLNELAHKCVGDQSES